MKSAPDLEDLVLDVFVVSEIDRQLDYSVQPQARVAFPILNYIKESEQLLKRYDVLYRPFPPVSRMRDVNDDFCSLFPSGFGNIEGGHVLSHLSCLLDVNSISLSLIKRGA